MICLSADAVWDVFPLPNNAFRCVPSRLPTVANDPIAALAMFATCRTLLAQTSTPLFEHNSVTQNTACTRPTQNTPVTAFPKPSPPQPHNGLTAAHNATPKQSAHTPSPDCDRVKCRAVQNRNDEVATSSGEKACACVSLTCVREPTVGVATPVPCSNVLTCNQTTADIEQASNCVSDYERDVAELWTYIQEDVVFEGKEVDWNTLKTWKFSVFDLDRISDDCLAFDGSLTFVHVCSLPGKVLLMALTSAKLESLGACLASWKKVKKILHCHLQPQDTLKRCCAVCKNDFLN